jgi:hypothetical protein
MRTLLGSIMRTVLTVLLVGPIFPSAPPLTGAPSVSLSQIIETNPKPPIDQNPSPPIDRDAKPPIDRDATPPIDRDATPPTDQNPTPPIDKNPSPPMEKQSMRPAEDFHLPGLFACRA